MTYSAQQVLPPQGKSRRPRRPPAHIRCEPVAQRVHTHVPCLPGHAARAVIPARVLPYASSAQHRRPRRPPARWCDQIPPETSDLPWVGSVGEITDNDKDRTGVGRQWYMRGGRFAVVSSTRSVAYGTRNKTAAAAAAIVQQPSIGRA